MSGRDARKCSYHSARLGRLAAAGRARVMEYWAQAPQERGQMVLFAARLDEAVGHAVRMLDEILSRIDWTPWEAGMT